MGRFAQFFSGRARSFGFAFRGMFLLLATQRNSWIHALATVVVVVAGFVAGLSRMEWCAIVLACAGVWVAEALNTAVEFLGDAVSQEWHPLIERAKDVAAAGVLIAAVAAAVVGGIVFAGHL